MTLMPSFSKDEIVLVRYPFSDLTAAKVRPAVVVSVSHSSEDSLIVPLTSRTTGLLAGEFVLADWRAAGLNMASAVKRGMYTVHSSLVFKSVGRLSARDSQQIERSLRQWLGLS
jgi:mRNA interferase MazF